MYRGLIFCVDEGKGSLGICPYPERWSACEAVSLDLYVISRLLDPSNTNKLDDATVVELPNPQRNHYHIEVPGYID